MTRIAIDWDGTAASDGRIDEDVLVTLSAARFIDDHRVQIPDGIDEADRDRVEETLRALGSTRSRRSGNHAFPPSIDARSAIERALATGTTKLEAIHLIGMVETPAALAQWLVRLADVRPRHSALEPSAGSGRIVDAMLSAGAVVSAVERREDRRAELTRIAGPIFVTEVGDFMQYKCPRDFFGDDPATASSALGYDRVVMHPPIRASGAGDHLDHVRRAHRMLGPGGVLVAILPASTLIRLDDRHAEFRAWCREIGAAVAQLPDGSLRESGTDMRVIAIRVEAPRRR